MDEVFVLTKKTKIIIFSLAQQEDGSATLAMSEPALIKEVSVSGVKRDESGKIKQTYTGESPKACST